MELFNVRRIDDFKMLSMLGRIEKYNVSVSLMDMSDPKGVTKFLIGLKWDSHEEKKYGGFTCPNLQANNILTAFQYFVTVELPVIDAEYDKKFWNTVFQDVNNAYFTKEYTK